MSLLEFVKENTVTTDKYNLGYIDLFYDRLFSPRKDDRLNLLELGTQYGDSVKLWRDYFQNGLIFGLDIMKCKNITNEERIVHIVGDAYSSYMFDTLPKNLFDIIIDDGPHTFESMQYFLLNYIKLLKKGGVMILEDIIDINWTPKLLELIDQTKYDVEVIETGGHQKTQHLLNLWSKGLQVIIIHHKQ